MAVGLSELKKLKSDFNSLRKTCVTGLDQLKESNEAFSNQIVAKLDSIQQKRKKEKEQSRLALLQQSDNTKLAQDYAARRSRKTRLEEELSRESKVDPTQTLDKNEY